MISFKASGRFTAGWIYAPKYFDPSSEIRGPSFCLWHWSSLPHHPIATHNAGWGLGLRNSINYKQGRLNLYSTLSDFVLISLRQIGIGENIFIRELFTSCRI